MIEKWVFFKRDYLEISFLRENCGYDGSDERRRYTRWRPLPHPPPPPPKKKTEKKMEQSIQSIYQDFALINIYIFHLAG